MYPTTTTYDPHNILLPEAMQTETRSQGRPGGLPDLNIEPKRIQIVDVDGNGLENAHVHTAAGKLVTDQDGFVTIVTNDPNEVIKITHVTGKDIVRPFNSLGSLITIQPNELAQTNVQGSKKVKGWHIALGVIGVFVVAGAFSGGKTGKTGLNGPKKGKKKNRKKKNKKVVTI